MPLPLPSPPEAALPYRQFLGHRPRSASSAARPDEAGDALGAPGQQAGPGRDGGTPPIGTGGEPHPAVVAIVADARLLVRRLQR